MTNITRSGAPLSIDGSIPPPSTYLTSDFQPTYNEATAGTFGGSFSIGEAGFSVGETPHYTSAVNVLPIPTRLSGLNTPLPTNRWWTNLFMGDLAVNAQPYVLRPTANGLGVNFPTKSYTYNGDRIQFINASFVSVISLESSEALSARAIQSYDELTVTMRWSSANGYLQSCFSQGMAYTTMQYSNLTPSINTTGSITSINGNSPGSPMSGTKFKLVLSNGQTWVLYSSSSITLTTHATNPLIASAPFTGTLQLTYISTASDEAILDTYTGNYPLAGEVEKTVVGNIGTLTFRYTNGGGGNLLTHVLPHHLEVMPGKALVGISYNLLKGNSQVIAGNSFTLQEPLPTFGFKPPKPVDPSRLADLTSALTADIGATFNTSTATADPYYGGKYLMKWARLAQIADELGETILAATARSKFKPSLIAWLDGTNSNKLRYDTTWKGVITTNGTTNSGADFGNGIYNDHHYHYGYLIYAAAILGKTDSTFVSAYISKVNLLVKEVANPYEADTTVTAFRHKDWYHGHSWAQGLSNANSSKNQESTSEAINCYYAITLWGLVAGDNYMVATGQLLLGTEIHSTRKYWHVNTGNTIYPADFIENFAVGIVWDLAVHYNTFFGSNEEYIHGIQMLPCSPVAQLYLESAWVTEEYPALLGRISPTDAWKSLLIPAKAIYDPSGAWDDVNSLASYDGGTTLSNLLHWVATR